MSTKFQILCLHVPQSSEIVIWKNKCNFKQYSNHMTSLPNTYEIENLDGGETKGVTQQ